MCSQQRGRQRCVDLGSQRRQYIAGQLVVLDVCVVHFAQQALEVPHVLRAQQREHAPCMCAGSLSARILQGLGFASKPLPSTYDTDMC